MKLNRKKNRFLNTRNLLIVVVLFTVISIFAFYYINQSNDQGKKEQSNSQTTESAKKDSMQEDNNSDQSSPGLPENSTSVTSEQVPTSASLSVAITSTSQTSTVNASAKTSGDGTCVFQYSPGDGGKPVISSNIAVNSGVCSYSGSVNSFSYLGSWKLKVTYYSGQSRSEATKDVTIN